MESKIIIDNKQIESETGLRFDMPEDVLYYLKSKIEFLMGNNKNLTKKQDGILYDLYSIISSTRTD